MDGTVEAPMLELRHLSKTFASQRALHEVEFRIYGGQVNALIGHNGSGKSTLIKIIAGYHKPDPGVVVAVDGTETPMEMVRTQLNARFVHQDLALVPTLSAIDNLALINGYQHPYRISMKEERRLVEQALVAFGIHFDVTLPVSKLTPLDRRLFAIARSLIGQLSATTRALIVLDEPTDSLPRDQVQHVLDLISRLASHGHGVLFVSHRINEVLAVSDRITALRDGFVVGKWRREEASEAELIGSITGLAPGREPGDNVGVTESSSDVSAREATGDLLHSTRISESDKSGGNVGILQVRQLSSEVVSDISFDVAAGEIVGCAGLEGSGYDEVLALLAGARPWSSGRVEICGKSFSRLNPAKAVRAGVSIIPRDRMNEGGIGELSIRENVLLGAPIADRQLAWISARREREEVMKWLSVCDVLPRTPEMAFGLLSGGNQQKAMLARALRSKARILLIDEPFQGVDVATRAGMKALMSRVAADGCAVILAAADPADLVEICTRILVFKDGVVVDEFNGDAIATDKIHGVAS